MPELTKKEEIELRQISNFVFDYLKEIPFKRKKALLRAVDKMNSSNCWWFSHSMKKPIKDYLELYFEEYELGLIQECQ